MSDQRLVYFRRINEHDETLWLALPPMPGTIHVPPAGWVEMPIPPHEIDKAARSFYEHTTPNTTPDRGTAP
jgi:hypothetical protein